MLLFINHQQPQLLKVNILRYQPMRPDNNINQSQLYFLQYLLLLLARYKPAEHGN